MNKLQFKKLVRRVLNEEIQKRMPEMNGNGVNLEKRVKTFINDANSRDLMSKRALEKELKAELKKVDPSFRVVWDDHDDLTIHAGDMFKLTITPLWEDNYKIVYMPRNEDRLFYTGLSWKQVLEFIKNNLNTHSAVEKAKDKSWRNSEDSTKLEDRDLSQVNKPIVKKVGTEKVRNKDYTEFSDHDKQDLPNAPMRETGEIKRQSHHKVKDPVRLRKRTPDKKLVVRKS